MEEFIRVADLIVGTINILLFFCCVCMGYQKARTAIDDDNKEGDDRQ